jgi:hypothetical protein
VKRVLTAHPATVTALAAVALLTAFQVMSQSSATPAAGYSFPIRDKNGIVRTWFKGTGFKPVNLTQPTVLNIEQFRVETAREDGSPELVGTAPQCTLDASAKIATSSGPLTVTQADGQLSLSGEGFRWDHESGRLTISNKLHVTFRAGALGAATPISTPTAKP